MSKLNRKIPVLLLTCILLGCNSIPDVQEIPLSDTPSVRESENLVTMSREEQLSELKQITSAANSVPKLGRGDVINISVYDELDLTLNDIPVRPDGRISFPLIGDVLAEGLTVNELNEELTRALEQFILAPKVSIIVQEFNSQQFTVFGEVVRPGVYPLNTKVTITSALAEAGGLNKGQFRATSVELADLAHAFIAREGQVLPVNFIRLIREGDLGYDIQLQSGDYIYIPSGLSQEVYILGEVNNPMLFAFRENMAMSRTLAQAEGFTPDADLGRIHIIRGSLQNPEVIIIDFLKVLSGDAREVALAPGDIIYVPPTNLTRFERIVDKIVPSMQAIQLGVILGQ